MKNKSIKASAPGKIHFLGEHTAVYGKPAILAAIDKRCFVELIPSDTSTIHITSKNLNKSKTVSFDEIQSITKKAQEDWEMYRATNDISIFKTIVADDALYPVIAIGETLNYFQATLTKGFELRIDSEIPMGSGHGSSAAVAVSIAGAVTSFLQKSGSSGPASGMTDLNSIGKIAIRVEQKKHGNPSYGDVGAVVNGGLIWFQKKTPEDIIVKPLDFSVPEKLSKNLLVIQSGVPEESTGEMVHSVAEFKKQDQDGFETILVEQEKLTHELLEAIKEADEIGLARIIKAGEKNLEKIGIVSPSAKALIQQIEQSGGVAKICGAGGLKKGSGVILAYHKDRKVVESLAKAGQLPYYTVALGGKGLQIE